MSDLSNVVPLIVPREYFVGGTFQGTYKLLKHSELAITWVCLWDGQVMTYITKDDASKWENEGIDWEKVALENLANDSSGLYTHEKRNEDDSLVFIAMMHEDGLGSSRLLLHDDLLEVFPQGYKIALPERSVGLAFPKCLNEEDYNMIQQLVQQCYSEGTTPMLSEIMLPEELGLTDETV